MYLLARTVSWMSLVSFVALSSLFAITSWRAFSMEKIIVTVTYFFSLSRFVRSLRWTKCLNHYFYDIQFLPGRSKMTWSSLVHKHLTNILLLFNVPTQHISLWTPTSSHISKKAVLWQLKINLSSFSFSCCLWDLWEFWHNLNIES